MAKNLFFVEFLPRVAAATATVSLKPPRFTFNRLGIYSAVGVEDCETAICAWDEAYEIQVTSSSDLSLVANEGLHIRFKAKCDSRQLESLLLANEEKLGTLSNCPLDLQCSFCQSQITRISHVFQRVLPLPSEAWGELSGSCFCHPPSPTEEGHTDPAAVKPRVGDCLLNDSVLLLQSCALNLDAIQLKKDSSDSVQRLHCARCLLCLGSAMETQPDELMGRVALHEKPVPVSLQRARVVLGGQAAVAPSREGSLAKRLHSTSKEQMASKLFIQDTAGKRYLLVWMLNVVSKIVYNTAPAASVLSRFTGDTGQACGDRAGKACDAIVLKLLYRELTAEESTADGSCEPLAMAAEECLHLALALADNHHTLPPSQRKGVNGFKVSFLRLSESKL